MENEIVVPKPLFLVMVFGLLISLGLAWHQYLLFMKAYLSPQKAVVLYINYYGEAESEFWGLSVSILIATITTIYILWAIRKKKAIVCECNEPCKG